MGSMLPYIAYMDPMGHGKWEQHIVNHSKTGSSREIVVESLK